MRNAIYLTLHTLLIEGKAVDKEKLLEVLMHDEPETNKEEAQRAIQATCDAFFDMSDEYESKYDAMISEAIKLSKLDD